MPNALILFALGYVLGRMAKGETFTEASKAGAKQLAAGVSKVQSMYENVSVVEPSWREESYKGVLR